VMGEPSRGRHSAPVVTDRHTAGMPDGPVDVVVLGEVLVELSSAEEWADGRPVRLGFSGDALNVAAAAVGAGARAALLARVPDDELGDALVARVSELGVDTRALIRAPGQHGLYLTHADPAGERHFIYVRRGSAGSQLGADDVDEQLVRSAGVVVASGIACAVSTSARAAVTRAAQLAEKFVYDPNFRPRLTTAEAARAALVGLASMTHVVTPSWPGEARTLLGLDKTAGDAEALTALSELGFGDVVLTCGPSGALVRCDGLVHRVPGVEAARVIDQTGAGDCLTGTVAARIALGDTLLEAVRLGVAAASLSVQGQGGTGHVPSLEHTRAAARQTIPEGAS